MTNNVKEMKEILKLMAKKEPAQPAPTQRAKQEWAEHVTEEEKNKAQSIIPKLIKNEVIIKLTKNGKMVVYDINALYLFLVHFLCDFLYLKCDSIISSQAFTSQTHYNTLRDKLYDIYYLKSFCQIYKIE